MQKLKDRFEQLRIAREDVAYVVANRLLKKDGRQKALVRSYLEKFYPLYENMAERAEQFVTISPVHSRIIEDWGDRTNLKYAVPRMLRSMVNWGVLQDTTNRGSYKPSSKIAIDDKDMKLWLLECYLTCLEQNSISVQSLNEAPALYPFAVNIKLAEMVASDRYEVSRQGLDVDVVELR